MISQCFWIGRVGIAAAVLLAALAGRCPMAAESSAAEPVPVDGTWRWTFTMPDGTISHPALVLETDDGVLTGTTTFRPGGEAPITNAVLQGNQLRFQVVRHRGDRAVVTTYTGTWTGKVIRGQVQSNWAGENQVYPWEARRLHDGAEGIWQWTVAVRGRKVGAQVRLAQKGEVLTGYVPGSGRGARLVRISRGSAKGSDIYFEIERGVGESKVLTVYKGKQSGDTIKGTITTRARGAEQESPWLAKRAQ